MAHSAVGLVVACSALKRVYRDAILAEAPRALFLHLTGSREVLASRLERRSGHFMPARLLQSQIDALEEPGPDEDPLIVDVGPPADQVAEEIIRLLGASATVRP